MDPCLARGGSAIAASAGPTTSTRSPILPQEQLISAFRDAIAVAEDPDTPGTPEQKRAVIEWLNGGINHLTRNVTWLADKLTDVI